MQPLCNVRADAEVLEHPRHLVDRVRGLEWDNGLNVYVSEERDLLTNVIGDGVVGAADDEVGADTDPAQLVDAVLSGLRLELVRRADMGQEREVDVQDVLPTRFSAHLADGLEEGESFDVTHCAADLDDDNIRVAVVRDVPDAALDLVRHVGDHLYGAAEEVTSALGLEHIAVDLAGGYVAVAREAHVYEALVVAEVQVRLRTVVGNEHLAVLERGHGARVEVDIRVQLLCLDGKPPALEDAPYRGRGDAFANRARYSACYENKLSHGLSLYQWSFGLPNRRDARSARSD